MIDSVEVDLPDSLVDDETEHRVDAREAAGRATGLTIEQVLEAQGWDEARLREDSRDHAVRAIKSDLVLEGVARAETSRSTADELGEEIGVLAQAYDRDPKELATQLDRSGQIVTLAGDIIRGKALDLLVERADITDEANRQPSRNERRADTEETPMTDMRSDHQRQRLPRARRRRADQPGRALVRHLLAAAEGAHRVPRHARSTTTSAT